MIAQKQSLRNHGSFFQYFSSILQREAFRKLELHQKASLEAVQFKEIGHIEFCISEVCFDFVALGTL